jgi:hypothetical protein
VGHGQGDVGGGLERAPAGQQLVQDHAEGVDVGGWGRLAAEHPFGGQVGGGAEQVAGGQGGLTGTPGDAEVEHLDLAAGGQEDVAGLDVAVDDPGAVGRLERVGNGGHDPDRLRRGHRPGAVETGGQALALEQLHDQVGAPVLLTQVEHPGNVRVVEPAGRPRLPAQALGGPAVAGQGPAEHLDGHRPVQQQVAGGPHLPHPAGGQQRPIR